MTLRYSSSVSTLMSTLKTTASWHSVSCTTSVITTMCQRWRYEMNELAVFFLVWIFYSKTAVLETLSASDENIMYEELLGIHLAIIAHTTAGIHPDLSDVLYRKVHHILHYSCGRQTENIENFFNMHRWRTGIRNLYASSKFSLLGICLVVPYMTMSSEVLLPTLVPVRTAGISTAGVGTVSSLPISSGGTSGPEPSSSTSPRSSTSLSSTIGSTDWASLTLKLLPSQLLINLELFCQTSSWNVPIVISSSTAALEMLIHLWFCDIFYWLKLSIIFILVSL